jgi:uncharacterized protein (TIGR02246 family)
MKMTSLASVIAIAMLCSCAEIPVAAAPQNPSSAALNRELSLNYEQAIRTTIEAYRTAWLANDAKQVLKTFTEDAVLMPAQGAPPVAGIAAIEKYWYAPGGPPTTVTRLEITVDQVGGNSAFAFVRGLNGVGWTVTEHGTASKHFHPGTYLDVLRKLPDGSWRIQVHMWDVGPERAE